MFNRCKHEWEILKDTTYPSKLEEYKKVTGESLIPRYQETMIELTERTVIVIMACKKCGKLKIKRYTI